MLPDFIIIGAMKCGTTSLHYYLSLHPDISVSRRKELDFFVAEENWAKGLAWYESQFPDKGKVRGEASPKYTFSPRHAGVPERMASVIPDAKLIYLVRDPLERIVSHYVHLVEAGREERTLDEALADRHDNPYLCRSLYYAQIERYLAVFDPLRILVVAQEDLLGERQSTLDTIYRFLQVRTPFNRQEYSRKRHQSEHKRRKTRIGRAMASLAPLTWLARLNPASRWHLERLVYFPFSTPIVRPRMSECRRAEIAGVLREDIALLEGFAGRRFNWATKAD
jgi:hypothetical protein